MRKLEIIKFQPEHMIELYKSGFVEGGLGTIDQEICWANARAAGGPAYTGKYEGKVIGCGGVSLYWPGVGQAWAVYPNWVTKFKREAFAYTKKGLDIILTDHEIWRVEAYCRADYAKYGRFLEHLGFRRICEISKFCPDKKNAYLYEIVR